MSQYQASIIFENELKGGTKMGVGIHSKCNFDGMAKGDDYYDLNFSDSDGKVQNKRLWQPKGNFPRKDKSGMITETQVEAKQREEKDNLKVVVKLLSIFVGKENLSSITGSYEEMMDKAMGILNSKKSTKKLNLKLILDSAGVYSTFSNSFPDYIEEHVEGELPKLTFTPWELLNRVEPKNNVETAEPTSQLKSDVDAILKS